MDFDDRVEEIDVRVDGQAATLEELSKSTATLGKFTESLNGNVVRTSKQITMLSRKEKKRVPDNKKGDENVIINAGTHNTFAPLASEWTDSEHKHTKAKRLEKRSQKGEILMQKKVLKRGCNVEIIGA